MKRLVIVIILLIASPANAWPKWWRWPSGAASTTGGTAGDAAADISIPATDNLHCLAASAADATWRANAIPECRTIEYTDNVMSRFAAITAVPPASGWKDIKYVSGFFTWEEGSASLRRNTIIGDVFPVDGGLKLHMRASGSRVDCPSGNVCCTAANVPCDCCTGAGTGTCDPAGETISWNGGDVADLRYMIGSDTDSGPNDCNNVGQPYAGRPVGEHELLDPSDPDLRSLILAEVDRIIADADTGAGVAPMDGIRIDEAALFYGAAGFATDGVTEFATWDEYVASLASLLSWLRSQRPSFIVCPSLPWFFQDREDQWDEQLIAATGCFATERFSHSYTRECNPAGGWPAGTCGEVVRQPAIDEFDMLNESYAKFVYLLHKYSLRVIAEPYPPARGVTWLGEMCATFKDACTWGIDTRRSATGQAPPYLDQ